MSQLSIISPQQQVHQEAVPLHEMRMSQSVDPIPFHDLGDDETTNSVSSMTRNGSVRRKSHEPFYRTRNYSGVPGNFSSLPRTRSHSCSYDNNSRGTKQYSSARYSSTMLPKVRVHSIQESDRFRAHSPSLSKYASFHGTEDRRIIVSQHDRNPMILSEEIEDDSYLYRKGSIGGRRSSSYERVLSTGEDVAAMSVPDTVILPHPRMHDILFEHQSASNATAGTEPLEPDSAHVGMAVHPVPTLACKALERSHSVRMNGRKRPLLERAPMMRQTSYCFQRGSSLRVQTGSIRRSSLPAASGWVRQSLRGRPAEVDSRDLQHQHTRNYESTIVPPTGDPISPKVIVTPTRRVSVLPSVSDFSDDGTILPSEIYLETEALTFVGTAQDVNQQVFI